MMRLLICLLVIAFVTPAHAGVSLTESLKEPPGQARGDSLPPAQEARAQQLFRGLRCMVCESQSLADSGAPLAGDMRRLIRERIAAGETDEAIRGYLVARYGEAILMQPPLDAGTAGLWTAPILLLAAGGGLIFAHFRRGKNT